MIEELRFGNKILRKNSNDEWVETTVNLTYMGLIYEFPEDYKPIPLTEEWLLKLGFENSFMSKSMFNSPNENFHIVKHGEKFIFRGLGASVVVVRTVHHLQNLYYAVSLSELEVK